MRRPSKKHNFSVNVANRNERLCSLLRAWTLFRYNGNHKIEPRVGQVAHVETAHVETCPTRDSIILF